MSASGYDSVAYFPQSKLSETANALLCAPVEIRKDHLTILQLSDLHFGKAFRFKPGTGASLVERVMKALDAKDLVIDAVVLSGDFGDLQPAEELDSAAELFDELQAKLGVSQDRWVVVPGNHDINWSQEKYGLDNKENSIEAHLRGTVDYFDFIYRPVQLARTCPLTVRLKDSWSRSNDKTWRGNPIRHFMPSCAAFQLAAGQLIEIHGFNSCLVEGSKWPGIGYVGKDQVDLFEKVSNLHKAPKLVKIAVLHHHVKEVSKVFELPGEDVKKDMRFSLAADARWLLDELILKNYGMLLHGHQHQPFLSQEVRACFGSDSNTWHRDFITERLLIFGAGSVSRAEPGITNSFFVHRVESGGMVETWNFSLGSGQHDEFTVKPAESCRQSLRNCLTPDSIRKRVQSRLAQVESSRPDNEIKLPNDCDAVESAIGRSLHEILVSTGCLKREGERYKLNLPSKQDTEESNRSRSNNLPARFASLMRLALKYGAPMFKDDWTFRPAREFEPHVFDLIRWVSLNLAKANMPEADRRKHFQGSFERQVLSEYPADLPLPAELCSSRHFVACVVARKGSHGVEVLLRRHREWEAPLLPVKDIPESKDWEGKPLAWKRALAVEVFDELFTQEHCDLLEFPEGTERLEKKQISPTKGTWTHYSFHLCVMKLDGQAQNELRRDETLIFTLLADIPKLLNPLPADPDISSKEKELAQPDLAKQRLWNRGAIANRMVIEKVLDLLKNPESNWFL